METERKKVTRQQIAAIFKVSLSTVHRWSEQWLELDLLYPINYNPHLKRQYITEYYLDEVEEALRKMKELDASRK